MQAVPAAASDGIIERKLQIVVAEEPVEGRPGFVAPAAVASYAIRLQTRRNRAGGFNRLLIEAGLFTILTVEALRTDRHEVAIDFALLRLSTANPAIRDRRKSCDHPSKRSPRAAWLGAISRFRRPERFQTISNPGCGSTRTFRAIAG